MLHSAEQVNYSCVPVVSHIFVTEPSSEVADFVKNDRRIALWDAFQLYHYVRFLASGRILVGGEESPGTIRGQVLDPADESIQKLYWWTSKHHKFTIPPIEHAWKASLVLPADGLPFLSFKQYKENTLIRAVTDGIPFAFVLARIVAELIENHAHPLAQIMSYKRKMPLEAKLLSLLPDLPALREPGYQAAFALLRLHDLLP